MRAGCACLIIGLLLYPAVSSLWALALIIPFVPIGHGAALPLDHRADVALPRTRPSWGPSWASAQTFAGIARVVAPILATRAFQDYGHAWPFYMAAATVALVSILAFRLGPVAEPVSRRRLMPDPRRSPSSPIRRRPSPRPAGRTSSRGTTPWPPRRSTPRRCAPWLAAWSRLEELITEAAAEAMIAYTADTGDPAREAAHLRFSAEIFPQLEEQGVRLARRLLATGLPAAGPGRSSSGGSARRSRSSAKRTCRCSPSSRNSRRATSGSPAASRWNGTAQTLTLPQLAPYLKQPDRAIRERAFRAMGAPYLALKPELAALFDAMYERRQRVARQSGFADFEAYSFVAKCRFDYTPDDCTRFHDAVEAAVVPAVGRILERRRRRLGLERLRPWDLDVDPSGRPALRPFQDAAELGEKASRVFHAVAPALGEEFDVMRREGLLDLESRAGKAPGGYCETLHFRGRPYIHMNAVGLLDDVNTLLHESGHSFHAFASHRQPLLWQRYVGAEAAELASMSMELLAAPYLAEPGGLVTPGGAPPRADRAPRGRAGDAGRTSPRWTPSSAGSTPAGRVGTRRRGTGRGSGSAAGSSGGWTGRASRRSR